MMQPCMCLCTPLGHSPTVCAVSAAPGMSVPWPDSPDERGVPSCPPCRAALRRSRYHEPTASARTTATG